MPLHTIARFLRARFSPRHRWQAGLTAEWPALRRRAAVLAALDPGQSERLRELATWFLARKTISPARGWSLNDPQRVLIAALCCLPVLNLGRRWLRGWSQVIVYPDSFVSRGSTVDDSGVVSEWEDELAGESWEFGPLLLSWADIEHDLDDPFAGYQLVAHEIAHKLDGLDGALDGTPPLPGGKRAAWVGDFQRAYDDLREQLDRGRRPAIDEYAATSPDEFFAVVSEYHFSAPDLLAEAMPAVAAHLADFYGPSPLLNVHTGSGG